MYYLLIVVIFSCPSFWPPETCTENLHMSQVKKVWWAQTSLYWIFVNITTSLHFHNSAKLAIFLLSQGPEWEAQNCTRNLASQLSESIQGYLKHEFLKQYVYPKKICIAPAAGILKLLQVLFVVRERDLL